MKERKIIIIHHKLFKTFRSIRVNTAFVMCIAIALSFGLKYHYSKANALDLKWILKPTSLLVSTIDKFRFTEEIGAGFIDIKNKIIIAKGCAGINFLIATFSLLIFSFCHKLYSCRALVRVRWSYTHDLECAERLL